MPSGARRTRHLTCSIAALALYLAPTAAGAPVTAQTRAVASTTASTSQPRKSTPRPLPPSLKLNALGQLTPQAVDYLLSAYHDWSVTTMRELAWCESRYEPAAWNPVAVWSAGKPLHSAGLTGDLGGSLDARTNVAQAHSKWLSQGYGAWRGDFGAACMSQAPKGV